MGALSTRNIELTLKRHVRIDVKAASDCLHFPVMDAEDTPTVGCLKDKSQTSPT